MRELKYKAKCIKMDEETWKFLQDARKKSELSWNLFLLKLIGKTKPYAKRNNKLSIGNIH